MKKERKTPIPMKKLGKMKILHGIIDVDDAVEIEDYVENGGFRIIISSLSIPTEKFRIIPMGKRLIVSIESAEIWEREFDRYISVDSIKKSEKNGFIIIEGRLSDYSEKI